MEPITSRRTWTFGEYMSWEAEQPTRNEFLAGDIIPLPSDLRSENQVKGNFLLALTTHLRASRRGEAIGSFKLRLPAADAVFYPSVMVSRAREDAKEPRFNSQATLVVEVLTSEMEGFQRGGKFRAYRTLATLEEYVLVDVPALRVDLFRRQSANTWVLNPIPVGAAVELESVGLTLPASVVFEDVDAAAS